MDVAYLLNEFTVMFSIPFMVERSHVMSKKFKSLVGVGYIVKKKIMQELKENRQVHSIIYLYRTCVFLP